MRLSSLLLSLGLLALSACGGGGGSAGTGTSVTPATPAPVPSGNMVFVGDRGNGKLAAVDTLTPKPGALTARIFSNDASLWYGAAFDGTRDELYVATSTQIDVYASASKLDGAIKAARTITPTISGLLFVQSVALDKANDRLYVGVKARFNGSVAVFEQASKLSGAVAPSRIISGNIFGDSFTLDLKRNLLYATSCCTSPSVVQVYEHIDTAKGETLAARSLTIPASVNHLAVDGNRDRLYMTSTSGQMVILDKASTVTGSAPAITMSMPTQVEGGAITIDAANDRLYAGFGAQAFVFNDASKLAAGSSAAQAVAVSGTASTSISFFTVPQ